MKKVLLAMVLVSFSLVTYLNAKCQTLSAESMSMESIEVMVRGEMDNGHWMDGETVRCKLELGGGMFTSSVMKVCVLVDYMSNCTGAACGEFFLMK